MRKGVIFLITGTMILLGAGLSRANRRGRAPADGPQEHLGVGGVDRTSILHTPKALAEGASLPLVLVFHGGGGHAATMPNFTHFDEVATAKDFWWRIPRASTRAGTTLGAFLRQMTSASFEP